MKIIYLHQYFNTPDMDGSTRSYEFAKRMVKSGHEVHMITSNRLSTISRDEIIKGIFVYWIGVPYNNKMKFISRIYAFFIFAFKAWRKSLKIDADIIFATSTPLTIAIPAILAKKQLKIPMCFEVRDLWPDLPISIGIIKNPVLIYFSKMLEQMAYKNSEAIICLSDDMCKGVQDTGYNADKIFNIPNSCDIEKFSLDKSVGVKKRIELQFDVDDKLILYAGTLGLINDVGYLVKLASHLKTMNEKIKFLIFGEGFEKKKLIKMAKNLGCLQNNIFFYDPVPKKEIPKLFSAVQLSVSCFLPLKEMEANSANKFFDTIAAGKPIVINYGGWQKKLIRKHDIGIVLNRNFQKSAENLLKIINDRNELKRMGGNALDLAKSEFSRDILYAKLISVLSTLN